MTTLGLHPVLIKGKDDRYTVINREAVQAISTSRAGVEAIRLLGAGHAVEETREILGRRYGHPAQAIDLEPLIRTLFSAGFVRTLDGRPVEGGDPPGRRSFPLRLAPSFRDPVLGLALRHLPPRLALRLAYRWLARTECPELERRIAANLRRAPDLDGSDRGIARAAARNREALRKQFCDRLLFGSASPHRLRRWLARDVRVSGLEHLERARAGGAGAILCSLHLGSYALIPFVLGARGVPVTVYGGFGEEARGEVEAWLAERSRSGDKYPVRLAVGTMGVRTLAHCLDRGETVLLYCDQAPGEADGAPEARRWVKVPFLGTRVWSPAGLGWLHGKTGAAILPMALLWEGSQGHHLRVDRQLPGPGTEPDRMRALMTAAYGALEQYVRQDPAQWLKWAEFDEMIAS